MELHKKGVFKAIVLMDTFNKRFRLISNYSPMALLSVAGVPHKDYALQSLAMGGITETILFCCKDPHKIEKFMKESEGPWKYVMDIQVKSSETCQSVGDVMREINAAFLVKGDFIHFSINTVTNIHLASLLEQLKQTLIKDKGAALTLVMKELCPEHSLIKDGGAVMTLDLKELCPEQSLIKDEGAAMTLDLKELCPEHSLIKDEGAEMTLDLKELWPEQSLIKDEGAAMTLDLKELCPEHSLIKYEGAAMTLDLKELCPEHSLIKYEGAAMTLDLKELCPEHSLVKSDKLHMIAADNTTKKILVHDKYRQTSIKRTVTLTEKHLVSNPEVIMHHNLVDSNIAVCSPSVLPLFGDTLDFQTLVDFFCALFIRVDVTADSLYYTLLKANQYAVSVPNWNNHKSDCCEMSHHYEYPFTVLCGAYREFHCTTSWRALRNRTADVNRSWRIGGDSILGDKCYNKYVSKQITVNNDIICNNVTIEESFIMDTAEIEGNVKIMNSSIDGECSIEEDCIIEGGTVIAQKLTVQPGIKLNGSILEKLDSKEVSISESGTGCENESVGSEEDEVIVSDKVLSDGLSCFSSDFREDFSIPTSPVPDNTTMFLGEVIDNLAGYYEDKLKCDCLILKINALRYAYNIQLHELNFYVVRALLTLPFFTHVLNVFPLLNEVITFFQVIIKNYIQSKSSVMDCLRAVEVTCLQFEWLKPVCSNVLQILYDTDIVDKEYLLEFYEGLLERDSRLLQYYAVTMFFEGLQRAEKESDG